MLFNSDSVGYSGQLRAQFFGWKMARLTLCLPRRVCSMNPPFFQGRIANWLGKARDRGRPRPCAARRLRHQLPSRACLPIGTDHSDSCVSFVMWTVSGGLPPRRSMACRFLIRLGGERWPKARDGMLDRVGPDAARTATDLHRSSRQTLKKRERNTVKKRAHALETPQSLLLA
jgi:hypothetical protein